MGWQIMDLACIKLAPKFLYTGRPHLDPPIPLGPIPSWFPQREMCIGMLALDQCSMFCTHAHIGLLSYARGAHEQHCGAHMLNHFGVGPGGIWRSAWAPPMYRKKKPHLIIPTLSSGILVQSIRIGVPSIGPVHSDLFKPRGVCDIGVGFFFFLVHSGWTRRWAPLVVHIMYIGCIG